MTYMLRVKVMMQFTKLTIGTLKTTGPTLVQQITDELMNKLIITRVTAR